MLHLKQAIIVEGKYDKIKLESVVNALIITTEGFGIYRDPEKLALIRSFARRDGIIILTDSDAAGFQIRGHLKSSIPDGKIYNVYIPDIFGKEKRKDKPSREGKLGVEGVSPEVLEKAFADAGVLSDSSPREAWLTRAKLLDDGLIGGRDSAALRKKLLERLRLPERLNTAGMLEVLNRLFTKEEYEAALGGIRK